MEIKYEIHTIENSQGSGKCRQYAQLRSRQAMTTDELGDEVQQACSITRSDLKAVMTELSAVAIRELSQGNRFYIPEIGYLSLSVGIVKPTGKANKLITGKEICLRGINFKPEKKLLLNVQRRVSFVKSAYTTLSAKYTAETLWPRVEAYLGAHRFLTRRTMAEEFGLSYHMARKWLVRFVNEGRLVKDGTRQRLLYFLA